MRKPGLWLANGRPTDVNLMYSWNPASVTCFMDYLGPNKVREYHAEHPDCPVIIRFQHPTNWMDDIPVSARNHADYVLSKWPEIMDIDPYIYFANETNLWYESGGNNIGEQWMFETPEFYSKFADWTGQVADRIKAAYPEIRLVTPPFAFGHHEDGAPDVNGEPKDGWAGYDYLADTIRSHFDNIITFHGYWGDAAGYIPSRLYDPEESSWYAFRWRRVLKLFEHRYSIQARVIIDECGNMDAAVLDFTDQCIYYAEECLKDNRVLALTYFLWEDPTESPGNIVNSWVQRCADLDGHLTRLAEMPPIGIEPDLTIRILMPDGTVVVLPLEEYLRGVVPAEMPALWPMEALKAQAVAARSYAMVAIGDPRHGPGADICSTSHCQNYNPERIREMSDQAIRLTSRQVITYQDELANAYYSANCGGHTVGNETGFGGAPLPHLRPVACINPGPKNGHRVGMCQWGAHDMAEADDDYVTILKHYYTGIEIRNGGNGMSEDVYVNDVRAADSGTLNVVPRVSTFEELQRYLGPQVDRSKGWGVCPDGSMCFKLVGFELRDGVAAWIPQIKDEAGAPLPAILVYEHWDNSADIVEENPAPRYELANGAGFTDANGVVGFGYGPPQNGGPGGGPFTIWPSASPPGVEPQYCDAARKLGWIDAHLNCNPIFQLVRKGSTPVPPLPPGPTPPGPVPPVPVPPTGGGTCTGSYAILSASILFSVEKLTAKQYMEIVRLAIEE